MVVPSAGGMCWAASASNSLAYTVWGYPTSKNFQNENDIFGYVKQYMPNKSGSAAIVYDWWFDGNHEYYATTGGGFYPNKTLENYLHRSGGINSMSAIDAYLHQGYGTTAEFRKVDGSWFFHQISIWGYEYNQNNEYRGFYYTDNNDSGNPYLWYMGVHIGDVDVPGYGVSKQWVLEWVLDGNAFYSIPNGYFLTSVIGLEQTPLPVPLPPAMLLLGTGIIGLAGYRAKKYSK
jgi:hypothetical protein